MINLEDILDMSTLTREEIEAVALHEHVPPVDAALTAEYLMHEHKGPQHIQQMICEDIREAIHADNVDQARKLFAVLHHFVTEHPEAVRGVEE